MARGLKKLGRGLKKFAKSKVGKIALITAGVAGAGFGGAALLGAAKGGKILSALKAGKGKGGMLKGLFRKKSSVQKGLQGEGVTDAEGAEIMKGSLGRLSKKLRKRLAKNQTEREQLQKISGELREGLGDGSLQGDAADAARDALPEIEAAAREDIQSDDKGGDNIDNVNASADKANAGGTIVKLALGGLGLWGIGKATGLIK